MKKTSAIPTDPRIEAIRGEFNDPLEVKGKEVKDYKISGKHFENGPNLHTSKYYFAKRYFQSSENCSKLSELLSEKLKDLHLDENTTLIGMRGYSGLLLKKTCDILGPNVNYAIIEYDKKFTWEFLPSIEDLKKNLVIILPITCTSSVYPKLRNYLKSETTKLAEANKRDNRWKVKEEFISIFSILSDKLEKRSFPILINENELELQKLYSRFDWEEISEDKISFKGGYKAYPLIRLYSDLYISEECEICFPGDILLEKNLFPTHNSYESPSLLSGYPSFAEKDVAHSDIKKSFSELFTTDQLLGPIHLYGHIGVNNSSFLHYIRGNTFFIHNRSEILKFFNDRLKHIINEHQVSLKKNIQHVIFITIEGKHNSTFLDEIVSQNALKDKKTYILQYDPHNEFIDNFMSTYKDLIDLENSLIIYFEEVISGGVTFKHLSNYLKHYKEYSKKQDGHGFDYVFTLINRTTHFTKQEIIRKLHTHRNFYFTKKRLEQELSAFLISEGISKDGIYKLFSDDILYLTREEVIDKITNIDDYDISAKNKIIKKLYECKTFFYEKEGIRKKISIHITDKEVVDEIMVKMFCEDIHSMERVIEKLCLSDISHSVKKDILENLTLNENSEHIKHTQKNFIAFYNLNVPVITTAHLGNPLKENVNHLKKMLQDSHLDVLKKRIGLKLSGKTAKELPEENIIINKERPLKYFPFLDENGILTKELYELYKDVITNGRLDLIKLYIADLINSEIALSHKDPKNLIDDLIKTISNKFDDNDQNDFEGKNIQNKFQISFLGSEKSIKSPVRNEHVKKIELGIVEDTIINILSQHPFIYYKNIYESVFRYCLEQTMKIQTNIEEDIKKLSLPGTNNFENRCFDELRKLKFYIRRLADLNSNYIISEKFLSFLRRLFERNLDSNKSYLDTVLESVSVVTKVEPTGQQDEEFIAISGSNSAYRYNQISQLSIFLAFCYKELTYKNHSRSIKLEELINSEGVRVDYLKEHKESQLKDLLRDPYYLFTGMVKAENVYLLNELKELHKNIFKALQALLVDEKYLSEGKLKSENIFLSDVLDQFNTGDLTYAARKDNIGKILKNFEKSEWISSYYFKNTGNISAIINAKKFILKSEFTSKKEDIQLSVANMLHSVTLLMENKLTITEKDKTNENESFVKDIRRIIESVVGIIQPGLDENCKLTSIESKLKYAFCIKYKKRTEYFSDADNIYTIISGESKEEIELDKEGLIYNLMYGLSDSVEQGSTTNLNEQSLLAAIKIDDKFVSFKNKYYSNKNDTYEFDSLYRKDIYDKSSNKGLPILKDAQMSLFFRLSKLNSIKFENCECNLEGQAVLVISWNESATIENYLRFMNNEKIRLLLLIKEELLEYLQNQFDYYTFIGALENRKRAIYQRHLRHGLNNYIKAQESLLNEIVLNKNTYKNQKLFDIVTNAIRGQLNAVQNGNTSTKVTLTRNAFVEIIRLLFEFEDLGDRSIKFLEVDIESLNFESIEMHPAVKDVLIPELIINMKKYCPRINEKGLSFEYNNVTNEFVFRNTINIDISSENYTGGEGLKMCAKILNILELPRLKVSTQFHKKMNCQQHIVKLKL